MEFLKGRKVQNCGECFDFWLSHPKKMPYSFLSNDEQQINLYQCKACKALWLETQRAARVINTLEAKKLFPNFDDSRL